MYFSRIRFHREGVSAGDVFRILRQDGYGDHQTVWRLFHSLDHSDRDFLFRRESEGHWPAFYTVSHSPPQDPQGIWRIDTKPYEPVVGSGDLFTFSLRANPVVTRWVGDGTHKKHARHDVVMEAKRSLKQQHIPESERPSTVDLAERHGRAWLQNRASKCGFTVDPDKVAVDGYRQHLLRAKGKKQPIRLSTLDFAGLLTVTDPESFREALFKGIGPAKSFGCGLMLLRRV